jgi:uncharacterized protein (DUF2132 family)
MSQDQPNNPLHGVTLLAIVEDLVARHGFPELAQRIDIGCFRNEPSVRSSLKFLRKTAWARAKVEALYLADQRVLERKRVRNRRRSAQRAARQDPTVEVYRPPGWEAVAALFEGLDRRSLATVGTWLAARADRLLAGWLDGSPGAVPIVSSWHPDRVGHAAADILAHTPDLTEARETVAREHGYRDWAAVVAVAHVPLDLVFEAALDMMLAGEERPLRHALAVDAGLARRRSPFAHGATLLHYLAANGVETERQVSPLNAPELAVALLEAGADVAAPMNVYGGAHTALELLRTSAHPRDAGVAHELEECLSSAG